MIFGNKWEFGTPSMLAMRTAQSAANSAAISRVKGGGRAYVNVKGVGRMSAAEIRSGVAAYKRRTKK